MDIRNLPDTVAILILGVAHQLDETAIDHELVNGSTVTGRAIRFAATSLVVAAVPWVTLDVVTGGFVRRSRANERRAAASEPSAPIWREFLQK